MPTKPDVSVPPNTVFRHGARRGYNAFAYVVEGRAYFDQKRDSYDMDVVGANYFDFKRDCLVGQESCFRQGIGQALFPKRDIFFCLSRAELLPLPDRIIRILDVQFREVRGSGADESGIEFSQFSGQDSHGPLVSQDVVQAKHQHVIVWCQPE